MTQIYAPIEEEDKIREENDGLIIMGVWNAIIGKGERRGRDFMRKYGENVVNRDSKS